MEWRARIAYAIIALITFSMVLVQAGAQSTGNFPNEICIITGQLTSPENCIVSAIPYMSIGIMLSFMIIALVYMLGSAMEYRPIQGWYKAELWQSVKTIILACVIISALVIMSAIANIFAGTSYTASPGNSTQLSSSLTTLYTADNVYINQQLNYSYQAYSSVLGLSVGIGLLKSIQFSFWLPIPIPIPVPPFPIIGALQSGSTESLFVNNFISSADDSSKSYSLTQQLTNTVVVPVMLAFQFQKDLFYDIVALGLGILIPIGMIFRAIPLIRDVGGTMIAIGIGIAIVYPALLLMLNMPISNYIYTFTSAQAPTSGCPFSSGLLCKGWSALVYLLGNLPGGIFWASTGGAVPATSVTALPIRIALGSTAASNTSVVNAYTNGVLVGFVTPLTFGIYPTLNFILSNTIGMILNFILFAIDMLFTLVITGGITQILGGKVRTSLGSKLSIG